MTVENRLSAPKRTRVEVQRLVAEFMSSGMRRSEFCRNRGLSFGTLNRHLKKQRWKRKIRRASSAGRFGRLVPVELAARKSPTQLALQRTQQGLPVRARTLEKAHPLFGISRTGAKQQPGGEFYASSGSRSKELDPHRQPTGGT